MFGIDDAPFVPLLLRVQHRPVSSTSMNCNVKLCPFIDALANRNQGVAWYSEGDCLGSGGIDDPGRGDEPLPATAASK